jgi:hypothetical protein
MRNTLRVAVLACGAVIASFAQQGSLRKPDIEALLSKLGSRDGGDRDVALYRLRSDEAALRNIEVRSALISLLDRENREAEAGMHIGEGEGYGEYFSDLLGTVESFADWSDQHQVCILVNAGANPDSPVASEAAARMKKAVPCLLVMSKGRNRVIAVPLLVEALAKSKDNLDPKTTQTIRRVVVAALRDSDEGVRVFTVDALRKFGGQDMIPALKVVAATDPAPEVQGHSIRKAAAKAIVAIQERAGQH